MTNSGKNLRLSDPKLLRMQCRIGAAWCDADNGGQAEVRNPATGALIGSVPDMGAAETCVCANRFLVQAGIYEQFAKALVEAVGRLKVGDGLDEATSQGPLIDQKAIEKVETHAQDAPDALEKGGRLLCGGYPHAHGKTFFEPTVILDAKPAMRLAREETFGPVAALFRFDDEAEAIAMANDTDSGLAAYCYTRDLARSWRVSEALQYGIVGINTGIISTEVAPFGGIKHSSIGSGGLPIRPARLHGAEVHLYVGGVQ